MYPEIDFWGKLPLFKRVYKKKIDTLRLSRMLSANAIIFETEDLRKRAIKLYDIHAKDAYCIKPSVSSLVSSEAIDQATQLKCEKIPKGFRILMLSGYHPNKNIELLPRIATVMKNRFSLDDVIFVTTLPHNHVGVRKLYETISLLGVDQYFYNIGPIPSEGCSDVYRNCDAVILPSRLESFSNNIAEAWTMGKPLLISDFDWSKELCGPGAVYFNYDDELDAAKKIIKVREDIKFREFVTQCGNNSLITYPNSTQRFLAYQEIIEKYSN
jgi:glycosyltransferase involved in cell wall biosynthesis